MSHLDRRRPLTSTELAYLAENIEDLSDIEDEYDADFQEIVSESEDNLESQSEEDSDELPDESNSEEFHCSQYVAKSGLKWNSLPFRGSRTPLRNIVNARPGPTPFTEEANDFIDIFNLFITNEMKDIICRYTNEEAKRNYAEWNKKKPNSPKNWIDLEKGELDCFFGVLIKAGGLRCRKESTREMWT